ncbi:MAG: hypothetical protein AABX23_01410 [Nanoarchaeota archaeon]
MVSYQGRPESAYSDNLKILEARRVQTGDLKLVLRDNSLRKYDHTVPAKESKSLGSKPVRGLEGRNVLGIINLRGHSLTLKAVFLDYMIP